MDNQEQPKQEATTAKKPYHTPKLTEYGDIAELTKSGGTLGMVDNPSGMKT